MAIYFADSSILVKRHIIETGTPWVQALTHPHSGNTIVIATITRVEVISAIHRRRREGYGTNALYRTIFNDFESVYTSQYSRVPITEAILYDARRLLDHYPLRAYDAVQLATALTIRMRLMIARQEVDGFLSGDNILLKAAEAEGFRVDNPNHH